VSERRTVNSFYGKHPCNTRPYKIHQTLRRLDLA
jgi:hypothetical protein